MANQHFAYYGQSCMKAPASKASPALANTTRRWVLPLALVTVYVVWGSTYLGIRFMVETIPPLGGNGIRMLTAGIILYGFLRRSGTPAPSGVQWRNGIIVGTLLFVGGLGQVAIAESLGIGSGLAATAIAMTPVWASLIGGIFGQWPGWRVWTGLAIGVLGVAALSQEGDFAAAPRGLVLVLIAPILWSFGSIWSNRVDLPHSSMRTALFMVGGGGGLLVASALRGEDFAAPSLSSGLALLYLTTFGSLLAFSAYAYLLRNVQPSLATSYAYVNPIVAVVLGVWLGGEKLTGAAFIALPLIVTAVALIASAPRPVIQVAAGRR